MSTWFKENIRTATSNRNQYGNVTSGMFVNGKHAIANSSKYSGSWVASTPHQHSGFPLCYTCCENHWRIDLLSMKTLNVFLKPNRHQSSQKLRLFLVGRYVIDYEPIQTTLLFLSRAFYMKTTEVNYEHKCRSSTHLDVLHKTGEAYGDS